MKLSEHPDYIGYMHAYCRHDLDAATCHLEACLRSAPDDPPLRAYLLHQIGNILHELGRPDDAFRVQAQARAADPPSLIARACHAKFFVNAGEHAAAIALGNEIITQARQSPEPASDDDLGSAYYIRLAQEIIAEAELLGDEGSK